MIDSHIHIFQGNSGEYTMEWISKFVEKAHIKAWQKKGEMKNG